MGAIEQEVKEIITREFKSVSEFARIANMSGSTLASLLNHGSFATSQHATVQNIARVLEVDAAALMKGELKYLTDRSKG